MFFTHDVLINTGGKFAIIWLAAMQNRKIKKRDYQSVELEQTCDELQKHFKPRSDGRMASVKGFSLRLSAQLVYGVLVVYHMKVSYLYNDANLSLQNLRRFKAQNQIYPSIPQIPTPRMTTVEMRHDDPIFGELFLLPEELNKSNMMMEDSLRSRSEIDDRFVVKDISNITLSDQPLHQVVGDSEFLDTNIDMEGFMGTNLFEDLDIVASSVDARLANITTPALHLPKTPQRPGKATERSKSPLTDDLSVLAVPLSAEPEPLLSAPEPLLSAPEPLLSAPEPLLSAPEPLLSAPEPLPSTPQSITAKAI
uniref:Rad21/Rec8-like protein N-terminal domain-containing protein n=1 Tax=Ciona savignyi TaxID=51511 RepID=H2YRG9_CIOSA